MEPEVFRTRLNLWKQLESQYGRDTSAMALERRSGINHGIWGLWASGKGKYASQNLPSKEQWKALRAALGFTWHAVFEDVYADIRREQGEPNRVCPLCGAAFRARGNQVYDLWFCADWVARQRKVERREIAKQGIRKLA